MAGILIVEDEGLVSMNTEMMLESIGHSVIGVVASAEEALELLQTVTPDMILLDIRLQGEMSGIDLARKINASSDIPIVYMTAYADIDNMRNIDTTRHMGILRKPFTPDHLRARIDAVKRANSQISH